MFGTIEGDALVLATERPVGDSATISGPGDIAYQFQIHQELRAVVFGGRRDNVGSTGHESSFAQYFA